MPSSTPGQRFLALDVFRGMTICFMIIVNTPGGPVSYAPLEHARWNGFTPTDLVFPSFLFAVGNAMSFVMAKWSTLSQSQVLGSSGTRYGRSAITLSWLAEPFAGRQGGNHYRCRHG